MSPYPNSQDKSQLEGFEGRRKANIEDLQAIADADRHSILGRPDLKRKAETFCKTKKFKKTSWL